jgi:uncharacterized protein (DUF433 family)
MILRIPTDPVPLQLVEGGTYRVGQTRVSLDTVIHAHNAGRAPEEIVREFDTLNVADVYAVIAYYLKHRADVDAYLGDRAKQASELRAQAQAQPEYQALVTRLQQRSQQG